VRRQLPVDLAQQRQRRLGALVRRQLPVDLAQQRQRREALVGSALLLVQVLSTPVVQLSRAAPSSQSPEQCSNANRAAFFHPFCMCIRVDNQKDC
jgi:hypothetical protein